MPTKMFSLGALCFQASSKAAQLCYHSNYNTDQNLIPGFMQQHLEGWAIINRGGYA